MPRERSGETQAQTWERDWRSQVMTQMEANTDAIQRNTVIQERMLARLDALENQPATGRAVTNVYAQVAIAILAFAALLVSLGAHISLH